MRFGFIMQVLLVGFTITTCIINWSSFFSKKARKKERKKWSTKETDKNPKEQEGPIPFANLQWFFRSTHLSHQSNLQTFDSDRDSSTSTTPLPHSHIFLLLLLGLDRLLLLLFSILWFLSFFTKQKQQPISFFFTNNKVRNCLLLCILIEIPFSLLR